MDKFGVSFQKLFVHFSSVKNSVPLQRGSRLASGYVSESMGGAGRQHSSHFLSNVSSSFFLFSALPPAMGEVSKQSSVLTKRLG